MSSENNSEFKTEDDQNYGEVEVIESNYNGEEGEDEGDDEEELAEEMIEMGIDEFIEELMAEGEEDAEAKEDNSVFTLDKHQGAVFCIDHFNKYLATGGEDDKAYVWTLKNDENNNGKIQMDLLFESEKFQDSVTNLKFSCDGKYLAVSDMSGKIRVYIIETKSLFWSHDAEMDIETMNWHPNCNVLFCGTSEGYLMMFKISTNEIKMMYFGDTTVLSCFRILKDGKRVACAFNNGNIRIIDLKTGQPEFNILNAHENDILCMDLSADGNLMATAGLDMNVKITNTMNGKLVANLQLPKPNEGEENSIESIGFCKTQPMIACGTLNGQIFVWDVNTHVLRNKLEGDVGFSKIMWTNQETLYASTLDGNVQSYDGRNLQLIKKFSGHVSEILDFCLDKDYLFTASNDNNVKVFEIN